MSSAIPIVDLQEFNLTKAPEDVSDDVQRQLAAQIIDAFSTVGFVGLTNYGIPQDKLTVLMKEASTFFNLPETVKEKYLIRPLCEDERGGWVRLEQISVNPERPGDLKESFNFLNAGKFLPVEEVPGFQPAAGEFSRLCWTLSHRILLLVGLGLGHKDPTYLKNQHTKTGLCNLRCLTYPPITSHTDVKPNQIRCGEHSDYGSITLLFQDDVGGLQLRTRDGEFVPAPPTAGTMLVLIGDLFQRWTADKFVSTVHRVIIPEAPSDSEKVRMTVAYFLLPDRDRLVQCLDGSEKYEPIKSIDFLNMRLAEERVWDEASTAVDGGCN